MNDEQIILVRDSFELVEPIADQAATLFYGRLFEIAPQVEPLFTGDMNEQGRKLMATLGVVVRGLDEFTPATEAAWTAAYTALTTAMIVAAYPTAS